MIVLEVYDFFEWNNFCLTSLQVCVIFDLLYTCISLLT